MVFSYLIPIYTQTIVFSVFSIALAVILETINIYSICNLVWERSLCTLAYSRSVKNEHVGVFENWK